MSKDNKQLSLQNFYMYNEVENQNVTIVYNQQNYEWKLTRSARPRPRLGNIDARGYATALHYYFIDVLFISI